MMQDTSQINHNKYACSFVGHEDEEIIGFCLFQYCENTAAFCFQCTIDWSQTHDGHQAQYCKRFKNIILMVEGKIKEQNQIEEDYKVLQFQLIKFENQFQKFLSYKSQPLVQKISDIIVKVQSIYLKLIERKQLLKQLIESLQQQNYEHFRKNLRILKICLSSQQKSDIFDQISVALVTRQQSTQQKMGNYDVQRIIAKVASLYLDKGKKLSNKKYFQEAIIQFDQVITRQEQLKIAFIWKGSALDSLGKYEDAIKCFDQAIRQDPKYSLAYYNKGLTLNNIGKYEDAINCFDQAIRWNPKYSSVYNNKGNALDYLCKHEDAIKCYDKAIKWDPKDSPAYKNKGLTLDSLGKYEYAIKCFDQAIRWNPKDSQAHYIKGNALYCLCKYEDAIKCYDEAIRLNPKDQHTIANKNFVLNLKAQFIKAN